MRKVGIAVPLTVLLTFGIAAQQQPKGWSKWPEEDVKKILNASPWGQTQTDTNTSEMIFSPTNGSSGRANPAAHSTSNSTATMRGEQSDRNRNRAQEGAYNKA